MHTEILKTIAEHTPYSYEQCQCVYNHCRSYDILIVILNVATARGEDPTATMRWS